MSAEHSPTEIPRLEAEITADQAETVRFPRRFPLPQTVLDAKFAATAPEEVFDRLPPGFLPPAFEAELRDRLAAAERLEARIRRLI